MDNQKLVSFDLQADFAFFKKPDYNDGVQLSYNMLHKPALLGVLGAIIGLAGYERKDVFPDYYQRLGSIPVGIEPLNDEKGNFAKTIVKYTNTVGYANQDGNLLVEESMLIRPAYRCYLLLSMDNDDQAKLYGYLKNGEAEFIPYLGKNEFQAWFGESFTEYEFDEFRAMTDFKVSSLFIKKGILKNQRAETELSFSKLSMLSENSFCYFERLPVGFDTRLMQYEFAEFAYTDWMLQADSRLESLYRVKRSGEEKIVQLF